MRIGVPIKKDCCYKGEHPKFRVWGVQGSCRVRRVYDLGFRV